MEGVFNIDKPSGISSHDVVNRLRRLTGVRRIGHAGTLDPLATGVMLLCIGRATRLIEYLVGHDKRYVATIRLGEERDSYDAEGEVVEKRPFAHLTLPQIEASLASFVGTIEQLPPMFSAIKQEGQPLYKLARRGVEVDRKPRTVTFYSIQIKSWQPPDLFVDAHVSSGTYIRSLAHDLGVALGCGGHIAALRRTAVSHFSTENSVALDELTPDNSAAYCLPMETAVSHLPRLDVTEEEAHLLLNGIPLRRLPETAVGIIAALFCQAQFWGAVQAIEDGWKAHKMIPPQPQ